MTVFKWLLRKRQSKGHGVHSPFAFDLITKVLYSPYSYYAFSDILKEVGDDPDKGHNQISFRLVNHFKPENILEVFPGKGVGSLYILSPSADINCTFIESSVENIPYAKEIIHGYFHSRDHYSKERDVFFNSSLDEITFEKFDAIFINLDCEDISLYSLERLFELSSENCFWVINHINKKLNKQLWRHIVNDARTGITFDFKNRTGIAFLRPVYQKENFSV